MKRVGHSYQWEEEEVMFLIDNEKTMSFNDIALKLGVSPTAVSAKAKSLGITHTRTQFNTLQWSQEQIDYLKEHFPTTPYSDLALEMGFSIPTIKRKVEELGLKRAKDYNVQKFIHRYVNSYQNKAVYGKRT